MNDTARRAELELWRRERDHCVDIEPIRRLKVTVNNRDRSRLWFHRAVILELAEATGLGGLA
jgi:hypothetical protein